MSGSLSVAARGFNLSVLSRQTPLVISTRTITYKKGTGFMHPKKVPAKFRVVPPTHVDRTYYRAKDHREKSLRWSTQEDSHPLTDNPMTDYPQKLPDGGIRYYGFTYYPRTEGAVEELPQEEVSPLFMVRRARDFSGIEWWHKNVLEDLGLGKEVRQNSKVVIVKNIPEMNEKLYNIKHLIEVTAIKLPPNLPLDADPAHCFLTDDGVFEYDPALGVKDEQLMEPALMAKLKMNKDITTEEYRNRWYSSWEMQT